MTHPERHRNMDLRAIGRARRERITDAYMQQCMNTFRSAMLRHGIDPEECERLVEQLLELHQRSRP